MNPIPFRKVIPYGIVIYVVMSGSHSYGINVGTDMMGNPLPDFVESEFKKRSDLDIRGIFIPYPKYCYGLSRIDEWRDPEQEDAVYFSIFKFLPLALECNPNVVEQLFVRDEHVLYMNELGAQLRSMAKMFLSKNAFARYASYGFDQLKKMTNKHNHSGRGKATSHGYLIERFGLDTKAAAHLVRLLLQVLQIFRKYWLSTYLREADRAAVCRVRHQGLDPYKDKPITIEGLHAFADEAMAELKRLVADSDIPETPDFDAVNAWCVEAVSKCHQTYWEGGKGVFKGTTFNILPLEYEMVDKTAVFLVSNKLVRKTSRAEAFGVCVPYKDWYIGLRSFSEFKFEKTVIDSLHKFVGRVRGCDPKAMDAVFAGESRLICSHPFAKELREKMKELFTTKSCYAMASSYAKGNLAKMRNWEKLKEAHMEEQRNLDRAKATPPAFWEEKRAELDKRRKTLESLPAALREVAGSDFQHSLAEVAKAVSAQEKAEEKFLKQYEEWRALKDKDALTPYPPVPKGTPAENSSYMNKYGYDTMTACEIVHVLRMSIELMKSGTIADSRAWDDELYVIKHNSLGSFAGVEALSVSLLNELDRAKAESKLGEHVAAEVEAWMVDFVDRFHRQLD